MPRAYAPMTSNQALQAALIDAHNHWNGALGLHNCGNQGTEYITFGQAAMVKQAWRDRGTVNVNGVAYTTAAGDSNSGNGNEIDLKLRDGTNTTVFNYHIALDSQVVAPPDPVRLDKARDAWREMNRQRKRAWQEEHTSMRGYQDLPFKEL